MKDWNRSISALMHLAKLRARRRWAEGKDGELDVVIRKFLYCCKSAMKVSVFMRIGIYYLLGGLI